MKAIDPTTGALLREYPDMTWDDVERRLERARAAFDRWQAVPMVERSRCLERAGEALLREEERLARLITSEMGKPIAQSRAELQKCAWACRHFAEHGPRMLERQPVDVGVRESFVSFRPLGVVLAIMPWNFPFWQAFRAAAPTMLAGNAVVLKHASNVPGCALAIEEVFAASGIPEGLFATLLVPSPEVGRIIAHPAVAAVTLTGSTRAGADVASKAGAALKKTVLELGGSDAYLILEDADLDRTVPICVAARLKNGGQSCVAAKRFVVVEELREELEQRMMAAMAAARVGPPLEEDTEVGPLARDDLRDAVHRQVSVSVERGARLLCGGEIPERPGFWYPPTVLADVRRGMPAYDEEVFGPVAAIISARDEEDGIRIANESCYGLGAAVFTRDLARGRRIAEERLEAGVCIVNGEVKSDPRMPFGGVKASGYGRELSSFGIRELVNVKTVRVH